jgi:ubiquitin
MRLRVDGLTCTGRAVDCSGAGLPPETVAAAIRGNDTRIEVDCPDPGPVHGRVGPVVHGHSFEQRPALAAAARSRGLSAPQNERIEELSTTLSTLEVPAADTEAARKRLAAAGEERDRLRERVAELRGRVRALREAGADANEAEAELTEAARALSEAETERAAAEQVLAREREAAREARDAREHRLELEDRLANRRREARAHLADAVHEEFEAAVREAPGAATTPEEADSWTAALAVYRVATVEAPVVVADSPFPDPETAADWLGAPVVRI